MTAANAETRVFEMGLDADPENLLIMRQAIDGLASSLDLSLSRRNDLKLAVTEACTNVIKYAYGEEGGQMRMDATVDRSDFIVTVSDDGSWKEPGTPGAPDEPGHGLAVIEAVCEDLTVDRGADGTTVAMTFSLSGPAGSE